MSKAFTLIELLVSLTVFTIVITAASGVFVSGINLQRRALSEQKLSQELNSAAKYMSRAIRMAKKDDVEINGVTKNCFPGQEKINYKQTTTGQGGIKFRNYKDQCQEFFLSSDGYLKESIDGAGEASFISEDFKVTSFNIELSGQSQDDDLQPRVTLFLEVEGKQTTSPPRVRLQTTISQRNPDVQL